MDSDETAVLDCAHRLLSGPPPQPDQAWAVVARRRRSIVSFLGVIYALSVVIKWGPSTVEFFSSPFLFRGAYGMYSVYQDMVRGSRHALYNTVHFPNFDDTNRRAPVGVSAPLPTDPVARGESRGQQPCNLKWAL